MNAPLFWLPNHSKERKHMLIMILRRTGVGFLTLWLVTVLVFLGTEILPGDVAQAILGQSATPETVAGLRETLGLNRPPHIRYFDWLRGFLTGDLGTSLASGAQISTLIAERLGNTLILAGVASAIVVPLSVCLGLLMAMYPESIFDRIVSVGTLFLVATPEFLLGTLLVGFFAVKLQWFPAVAYVTEFKSIGHFFNTMALPILTLAAALTAQMTRMTRATILNILGSSYVEMALLKGVRRWRLIFVHALRNAIGPIANVVALNLAYLISGVVITETIFAYPGLAKLIVDAVSTRDFPVVQSCALVFCTAYIIFMLAADIIAILSNPRLRNPRN
jgi:peptide/nickel transport system permease protein